MLRPIVERANYVDAPGKRRPELCAAAAPSREPVRAEEARRCGVFSGALRRGYFARTWAALDERSVRIPGQYLPRSNDFPACQVGSGVADT
jgi:hypothetical protein